MEIEFAVKVIPIDENHQQHVQGMLREGWGMVSGFQAMAIYPVQRIKGQQQPTAAMGGAGGFGIDESKVFILREGKLLGPGEEGLPENQPDVLRAARLRREQEQQNGQAPDS